MTKKECSCIETSHMGVLHKKGCQAGSILILREEVQRLEANIVSESTRGDIYCHIACKYSKDINADIAEAKRVLADRSAYLKTKHEELTKEQELEEVRVRS